MKTIADALHAMLPAFAPIGEERVALDRASGRTLAVDIEARFDSPPFDNSAMDGYAVRSEDVMGATKATPIVLTVSGESRAGTPAEGAVTAGMACRIFTGAEMPEGADAVVIQEDTRAQGDEVVVLEASPPKRHVRHQGSDLHKGDVMVPRGASVGPGEIGLLASQNIAHVSVFKQPTVAILSTGDELRELGEPLPPGTIVNSNLHVMADMVRREGAIARTLAIVPDDLGAIENALREALKSDVVLTTGGASVGDYDLVQDAFERIGIDIGFWKVRIKPGKPIAFGEYEGTPVIGLPGNPISAMVTFEILVTPCLRTMGGDPAPHPRPVKARLREAYRRRPGRVEVARGHASEVDGELYVTLNQRQGSGSMSSFVGVNALVLLPADRDTLEEGEEVDVLLWGAGLRSGTSVFARYVT